MPKKIYVASSWRNPYQPGLVKVLRDAGHEVYDFRNPAPGNCGFSWSEIDPEWQSWSTEKYIKALDHHIAEAGFTFDKEAMEWATHFVLVLPSGRSAHFEAGWARGAGKPTAVLLLGDSIEPELMYKLIGPTGIITDSMYEVLGWLDNE